MSRKPRADSYYDTLSPKQQERIVEHARAHKLEETVAWHQADGLSGGSVSSLSRWLSGWRLRERLAQNATIVDTVLAEAQKNDPTLTTEKLFPVGQAMFSAMAIDAQDPQVWLATQRLELERHSAEARWKIEREKLAQAERKIVLLEAKAAQADATEQVLTSAMTEEERAQRIKEIYGRA